MIYRNFFVVIGLLFLLSGCDSTKSTVNISRTKDGKYDSEFPYTSLSSELENISQSVKKIDVLAFYSNYFFSKEDDIHYGNINDSVLRVYKEKRNITHSSVSGTASIIYSQNGTVCMLTCAHVINFEDTLFAYYEDGKRLKSISIKIRQQNSISDMLTGSSLEILAMDKKKDVALLIKKSIPFNENVHVLNYPVGNIKDLQWGSLVYIMGYPHGSLMVTRALASLPGKSTSGIFTTDALYNKGISGSPVFSIRDGVPNIEIVGIALSSAAEEVNFIVADNNFTKLSSSSEYRGDFFVDNRSLISYGITYSLSINEILSFIASNGTLLLNNKINTNLFFK